MIKRESVYRSLTVVAPVIAVLCASGVTIFEWQRLKRLEAETAATESKLNQISQELRSYAAQPPLEKYPTEEKSPREQALFLDTLRKNADACKVQLVRWSNISAQPASSDNHAPALPAGVSAVVSVIEVSGRSADTRQFLYNVMRMRRLLNMTDLKWVRDKWPLTHLTFTLTRYIGPPSSTPPNGLRPGNMQPGAMGAAADSSARNSAPAATVAQNGAHTVHGPINLPNPMDAPGIAHGPYQSELDTRVSQITQADHSKAHDPMGSEGQLNPRR